MTTPPHPKPTITESPRGHRRVRRYELIIGVSVVVLALAWWLSPLLVGILALAAPFVLAIVLTRRTTDIDLHGRPRDWRNDVGWWL